MTSALTSGTVLLAVALIVAAGDWYAVAGKRKSIGYVLKPAVMVIVIAAAWVIAQGPHDGWMAAFLIPGLVFALIGDIFLMLPGERYFLPGLVAFLVTQVCYIVGLNPSLPPWPALLAGIPVVAIAVWLFRRIARSLTAHGQRSLLAPVAVYSTALSLMLFSGWATLFRPEWSFWPRLFVVAGSSLFFFSDAKLAWDRFVARVPSGSLPVIVTYNLAQVCLTAGLARFA